MEFISLLFFSVFLIMFSSGLSLLFSRLFRLEPSFSLFFSQSFLIVLMFIAGLYGLLNIASFFLPVASIAYLFYLFFRALFTRDEYLISIKLHFEQNMLVYFSLLAAFFVFYGQFVGHHDEFVFWAASVKEMLSSNALPAADSAIYYKMYHPGLTLYHYVNLRLFGNLEPNIYISYLLLNLSAINVISHRFRNYKYLKPFVFICLTFLSYKVLGLGFKLLLADQYLANAFFACLFVILLSIPARKLSFLIIPISALALAKHPGILLGVVLLLLMNVRRFSSQEILSKINKMRVAAWVFGALVFEIIFFTKISTAWTTWIDSHQMNGLFIISMRADSLVDVMRRFIHGNISSEEIGIFKQFLDKLMHLKIGIPREVQLANARWSIFFWLSYCSVPLLLVRWKGLRVSQNRFNLSAFLVIFMGLVIWIFGIYLLAIRAFQYSSEGLFPSMDRYAGIYISGVILYVFSFIAYWGILQKDNRLRLFVAIALLTLICFAPTASWSFFNERELIEGKAERDLFNQLDPHLVSKLNNTSKICIIYNGPDTYIPATIYGILPARVERADSVASIKSKIPPYEEIGCTHFIGFCVSAVECSDASNRLPSLFIANQPNQIWLKTYESIRSVF